MPTVHQTPHGNQDSDLRICSHGHEHQIEIHRKPIEASSSPRLPREQGHDLRYRHDTATIMSRSLPGNMDPPALHQLTRQLPAHRTKSLEHPSRQITPVAARPTPTPRLLRQAIRARRPQPARATPALTARQPPRWHVRRSAMVQQLRRQSPLGTVRVYARLRTDSHGEGV